MAKSCNSCSAINPFTRTHYDKLREAQRRINDLIPLLDKIENCGEPCEAFREVAGQVLDRLGKIQLEFMTPPPKK